VSGMEMLVTVVFLLIGYWVVSALFPGKPTATPNSGKPNDPQPEQEIHKKTTSSSVAWHEILSVSPNATVEDIRTAYRKLMSQYHPDKVATLGQELRDLAEHKSKQITTAYRQAMQIRGVDAS